MPDRRNWERFPPQFSNEEEAVIVFEGHKISGAVSNLSQGGICVIVMGDAGIPLGNQSVLLKGVNDDPEVMKELVQKLLAIRVKPYLIYLMDLVQGAEHFRTSVQDGLDIIQALRGFTSGMAVPTLVIDAPGGGGKIPITPDAVVTFDDEEIVIRNYEGELYRYPSHPADQPVQTANDLSA